MKIKKKWLVRAGIPICIMILVYGIYIISNPIFWPRAILADRIQFLVPLGTDYKIVEQTLVTEGWVISSDSKSHGYMKPGNQSEIIGVSYLLVTFDDRLFLPSPVRIYMDIYFGFDADDKLIEVSISRDTNAFI